jgi:hypothetical protein
MMSLDGCIAAPDGRADNPGGVDHHGRGVPISVVSRNPAPATVAAFSPVTYVDDGIERCCRRRTRPDPGHV